MQRRIKQLIDKARQPGPIVERPPAEERVPYTKELELAIKADFLAGRTYTYAEAAKKFGCSPEKMRLLAQEYPVSRGSRPHRIPECVFKLIVRDNVGLRG